MFPKGTFEASVGALIADLLGSPFGRDWWQRAKHIGFIPGFVVDVDRAMAAAVPSARADAA